MHMHEQQLKRLSWGWHLVTQGIFQSRQPWFCQELILLQCHEPTPGQLQSCTAKFCKTLACRMPIHRKSIHSSGCNGLRCWFGAWTQVILSWKEVMKLMQMSWQQPMRKLMHGPAGSQHPLPAAPPLLTHLLRSWRILDPLEGKQLPSLQCVVQGLTHPVPFATQCCESRNVTNGLLFCSLAGRQSVSLHGTRL